MKKRDKPLITRRDFFKNIMRIGAAGALTAGAVSFVYNSALNKTLHTCTGDFICKRCQSVNTCVLPQAVSFRNHIKKDR